MIFTDKGNMYRLLVDSIPEGNNTSKGVSIKTLIQMEPTENPSTIYSIYRDTDAKYVLFTTKKGLVKKTSLDEYTKTKKRTGIGAITIREGDSLANVSLIKDEPILIVTKQGMVIKFNSSDVSATSRATSGVKGIDLKPGDEVVTGLPLRNQNDSLGLFSVGGYTKKVPTSEFIIQKRGGRGIVAYKASDTSGDIAGAALISDEDSILIIGNSKSICLSATDIPAFGRQAAGNIAIKDRIQSISKV